jgi:hypothetical protein
MSQITKSKIIEELQRIAEIIGAEQNQLPTVCNSKDQAWPNIEFSSNGTAYYEAYERGEQLFSIPAFDLEHLMFMSFKEVSFIMATEYELQNRSIKEDFRRQLFSKQVELMHTIKSEWARKIEDEVLSILKASPFVDDQQNF